MVITAAAGAAARAILDEYGIDINDAENGVFLPTESGHGTATIHTGRHTNAYMREVTKALTNANPQSKSDVLAVLDDLRQQLLEGILKLSN